MKLGRQSSNVSDRRGMGGGTLIAGGGIGTIVIVVLALLFGADPSEVIQTTGGGQPTQTADPNDPQAIFVRQVLADTEDTWKVILPQQAAVAHAKEMAPRNRRRLKRPAARSILTGNSTISPIPCSLPPRWTPSA